MNPSIRCLGLAVLTLAAGSSISPAQCTQSKIMASDRQSGDAFGAALAISSDANNGGPRLLVGAWGDDTAAGVDVGSVYTFYLSSGVWTPAAKIVPADAQPGDSFGSAVSVRDPVAIVGASGVGDTGAAYIFERTGGTWAQTAKIIPAGSQPQDEVGHSVAVDGAWGLIGIPGRDVDLAAGDGDSDPDAGVAVLVHKVNGTWSVAQTFPSRTSATATQHVSERYGNAVAIAGPLAICGAPNGELTGNPANHGFVEVYRAGNPLWIRTNQLSGIDPQAGDHFGAAVATNSIYLAIGAPDDDLAINELPGVSVKSNSGSVTVFRWDGSEWLFDGRVFAQDATDNARFGSSVAIDNERLVVGAVDAKKAYVFKRVGDGHWSQVAMLSDPDDAAAGGYARSVAIGGGQIVVGDRDDETSGFTNHGAAYATPSPADSAACDACDGATATAGNGSYTGCTTGATLNGGSSCGGGSGGYGPDVYYSWTPHCSGQVTVDTLGSTFDTVLSVHSACPASAANTLFCNDDGPGLGLASQVSFVYVADMTYLIRISGYNGASGAFGLRVIDQSAPSNDNCSGAITVHNGTTVFDTCRANTNVLSGISCAVTSVEPSHDVWFRYQAPCNGQVHIDTCGSNFDTVLQVFGTACPASNSAAIACNDDAPQGSCAASFNTVTSAVEFGAAAGESYLIRIGGWDGPSIGDEAGHGLLNMSCAASCVCDWNLSGQLSVQDIFDFLASYFAGQGDFNASGQTTVQDIFDFLACYFAGCN